MRKKKSEGERRWEVGESEEERMGGGKKVVLCCVLAVARVVNSATAKNIAAARFLHTRYC